MMKIFKSLSLVAVLVAIAAGATYAALHDVKQVAGTTSENPAMAYEMAEVKVGYVANFPMKFANMVPGSEYTKNTSIKYEGTTNGDLYFGATHIGGGAVFTDVLEVAIEKVNSDGSNRGWATGWVEPETLFASWTKLDSNIAPNTTSYYKIHVRVKTNAGNNLQGQEAYNGVVIEAIQAGATPDGTPLSNKGNSD